MEHWDTLNVTFPPGILEVDTATTHTQRKASDEDVKKLTQDDNWEEHKTLKKAKQAGIKLKVMKHILKKPAATRPSVQRGRFLVIVHRETGNAIYLPLSAKLAAKGCPPEGVVESYKAMSGYLQSGHSVAADGSLAFKVVFKALG